MAGSGSLAIPFVLPASVVAVQTSGIDSERANQRRPPQTGSFPDAGEWLESIEGLLSVAKGRVILGRFRHD